MRMWHAIQARYLLATSPDDDAHIHVMDLSGNVVKRIAKPDGHNMLFVHLDLACVHTGSNSCCVLNLATGATYTLPKSPAPEHVNPEKLLDRHITFAFGRVASTGEYKVLRTFDWLSYDGHEKQEQQQQFFEVFTINGGVENATWRARQSHDHFVAGDSIVVDGVVYFFMNTDYHIRLLGGGNTGIHPDCVASFDLGTEEWRGDIQGPIGKSLVMDGNNPVEEYLDIRIQLTLSDLKGSPVLVYHHHDKLMLDLWFLRDFGNGLWVKQIVGIGLVISGHADVYPLFVLSDGRLVILLEPAGALLICDPLTNTCAQVGIRHIDFAVKYTGSLLSLPHGGMV